MDANKRTYDASFYDVFEALIRVIRSAQDPAWQMPVLMSLKFMHDDIAIATNDVAEHAYLDGD